MILRGCSYENSFPVAFSFNREKDYFLAFIYEIFPHLGEIYFGELLSGKNFEKQIFKMGDINL